MMPVRRNQNWLPGIFNDFFGNEWIQKSNEMIKTKSKRKSNMVY